MVDGQAVTLVTKDDVEQARAALGSELRVEMQEVRAELKSEIQEVRTELKGEIQEVRAEIQGVRAELTGEIQDLRAEVKTEIQEVRGDIQTLDARLRTMERIGWAVALSVLALLLRDSLGPLISA